MLDQKISIFKGTMWSVTGQIVNLLVSLVANIWLARLLSPQEFGQIGIIMFFIILANVLTESGLGGALVRKKNATVDDYSTVFVTNLIFSFLCYFVLALSSGAIAFYYNDLLLRNLLLVAGLVMVINAFEITQSTKLISEMRFRQQSIYRFFSVLLSYSIGIYLAYRGYGVWALVLIQVMNAGFYAVILWVYEGFFMRFYFSKTSFKELYSFGVNTTLASLINTAFDNIYLLVLGKYFSVIQTGYFYQAKKLQEIPGGIMNTVTHTVVFSSLSKLQENKKDFCTAYNKINLYFLLVLGLTSIFIYIYATPIISILFGEKWLGSVFFMKLLTVSSFFFIQEQINKVIFKVFNQTKKILTLEIFKKLIQSLSIILGLYYLDLKVLIEGLIVTNIIGYLITFYYSRKISESSKYIELIVVGKIIFVCIISVVSLQIIINSLHLKGNDVLFTIPALVTIYALAVHLINVVDLKNELENIKSLLSKN